MSEPCTCEYFDRYGIEYCRTHKAAPELLRLLGLIAAEFKSDPTSVACFDLDSIVYPAIALVEDLERAP